MKNVLSTISGSITEIYDFTDKEIIIYIENTDATKDIENELKELLEIKKNLSLILVESQR